MKKILIIEDEPAYLKLLHSELTKRGYQVSDAVNGKKGLEIARKEKPDLILLDIRMPIMDGMAMLHTLRSDTEIATTKVVMLTNLEPDDKILGDVMRDQPLYYCVKSDTKLNDLLKKIEELLQN